MHQLALDLFEDSIPVIAPVTETSTVALNAPASVPFFEPDLGSYDTIIVAFSGGRDSEAMVLDLLERGVPKHKIELWHHCVDGREKEENFIDWPVTEDYCRKFAEAFGLRIYFSWRIGGFERELNKHEAMIAPVAFETPDGLQLAGGTRGSIATRRRWPAVGADLRTRWCSPELKIGVMSIAINNQPRFRGKRVLVMTGERAEESANRAKYAKFEDHRCHAPSGRVNRTVHHWRSVHSWSEHDVWAILQRHGVVPHVSYRLGWSRCSCIGCIFGSPSQWASFRRLAPFMFFRIADLEVEFNHTIQRDETVLQRADRGQPYEMDEDLMALAMSKVYTGPILVAPKDWRLPKGAFGDGAGPC